MKWPTDLESAQGAGETNRSEDPDRIVRPGFVRPNVNLASTRRLDVELLTVADAPLERALC